MAGENINDLNAFNVGNNENLRNAGELRDLAQEMTDLVSDRVDLYKKLTPLDKELIARAQSGVRLSNKEITILKQTLNIKYEQLTAEEQANELAASRNDLTDTWVGQLMDSVQALKDMAQNPLTASVLLMGALSREAALFLRSVEDVRMELGASGTEAVAMTGEIAKGSLALGYGYGEAASAASAIVQSTGDISTATSENIKEVAKMAAWYGVSAENAATLQRLSSEVGGATLESYRAMAQMAGVPAGVIMADVASNAEYFAKYSKEGGKNIYDAAVAAKQLGLSLGEVEGISSGLLDVQSSIEAEMNASVLIGKAINFNRAREAALAGDQVGMMKAVVEQLGSINEWERMNVIQREAFAGAIGLSVSQMQTMISQQEDLNTQAGKQDTFWGKIWLGTKKVAKTVGSYKETLIASGNFLFAMSHNMGALKKGAAALTPMFKKLSGVAGKLFKSDVGTRAADNLKDTVSKTIKEKATEKASNIGDSIQDKGQIQKTAKTFGKINMADVVKGAAAMAIMAGALWIFGKALQEIAKVENVWKTLAVAGAALLGFTVVLAAIGAIMMSGVGAAAILAGAGAFVVMAGALWILGKALQEVSKAGNVFTALADGVVLLGSNVGSMALIGIGFVAMGAGAAALAAGLLVLAPLLPVMAAMSAFGFSPKEMSGPSGKESNEPGGVTNTQSEMLTELKAIRVLLEKGADIRINEKSVGKWMGKYQSSVNALEN